jgi:regulator of sigma E protease
MLTAVSFIFVFGLIVFFHEFGHFIFARLNGVTVHEFSLGMGPKIISKQGKETLYALRVFPIGGFVRMEGEEDESDVEGSFSTKKPLSRFLIIAAGPLMNFLLSIVLFIIIFSIAGIPSNVIGSFTEDSPAYEAGLQSGDEILEINNVEIKSWNDVNINIGNSSDEVNIIVKRGETVIEKSFLATTEEGTGRIVIGIYSKLTKNPIKVVVHSISQVGFLTKEIFKFFAKLPFGGLNEGSVVGPVGIVNLVGQAAERSILDVLFLAAYISINLGIVNLLPIPALDGGRLLFIIFEIFRGKPVNPEKENFVHLVGFVILLSLMAFLVVKDVIGLF